MLSEVKRDRVATAIKQAQEQAGGELGAIMELVIPIFAEMQGHAMTKFGFTPNDDGFEAFARCLRAHESDADFKLLSDQLKTVQKASTQVNPNPDPKRQKTAATATAAADAADGAGDGDGDGDGDDDDDGDGEGDDAADDDDGDDRDDGGADASPATAKK